MNPSDSSKDHSNGRPSDHLEKPPQTSEHSSSAHSGKIKALILSGAVFPGLGQLTQGKKVIGTLIIAISVVLLFLLLKHISQEIITTSQALAASGKTQISDAMQASQTIVRNLSQSSFFFVFYGLVGIWLFSMLEVLRTPKK